MPKLKKRRGEVPTKSVEENRRSEKRKITPARRQAHEGVTIFSYATPAGTILNLRKKKNGANDQRMK